MNGSLASDTSIGGDALRAMAHAIRSPMNVIGAATHELVSAPQDERASLLAMVSRSVERLQLLAERLEWLAELQSKRPATLVRSDVTEIVKRLGDEAIARQPARLQVELVVPERPAPVLLDVALFEQALRCLLENSFTVARKRVLLRLVEAPDKVAVLVEDDGPAFDPVLFCSEASPDATDGQRRLVADLCLRLRIAELATAAQGGSLSVERNEVGTGMRYLVALRASNR